MPPKQPEEAYTAPAAVQRRLAQLGIAVGDVEDIYPLSPGQVEFLTQGNKPEQYWQLMAIRRLPPGFDLNRWVYLTTKLTRQNQILHTLYVYPDGGCDPHTAVQAVLRHSVINLRYRCYSDEAEKQRMVGAEWEARFDPALPFVRYSVLENGVDGSRDLVVKLDHASYDGTLLHLFDAQFQALDARRPIPPHTAFRDFIRYVTAVPKQPQLDYWVSQLCDTHFDFRAE